MHTYGVSSIGSFRAEIILASGRAAYVEQLSGKRQITFSESAAAVEF